METGSPNRYFLHSLVPGGILNAASRQSTDPPPPTKRCGCSTSPPTRASGGTWRTRCPTWSNGCWPDSPTTTKRPCPFIFHPTTLGPIPAITAEPGCPGWMKTRTRRENTRECTRKVGAVGRKRRRRSAGSASCSRSS